jgi:hypothetical protein
MARHGDASHDDEHTILLDRHCCTCFSGLAHVRLTQCDEVSQSIPIHQGIVTNNRRRMGYEFFKATHFTAVVVFVVVFFWHCDYTLTSW